MSREHLKRPESKEGRLCRRPNTVPSNQKALLARNGIWLSLSIPENMIQLLYVNNWLHTSDSRTIWLRTYKKKDSGVYFPIYYLTEQRCRHCASRQEHTSLQRGLMKPGNQPLHIPICHTFSAKARQGKLS